MAAMRTKLDNESVHLRRDLRYKKLYNPLDNSTNSLEPVEEVGINDKILGSQIFVSLHKFLVLQILSVSS